MANETKIPLFRRFVIQNFPFIEQDFDALTDYQLISKVVEYLNKVIESQNGLVDDMNDLETAFNTLKDYVDHYFDNLDVQEEINNKLDAMAEAGTLQDIIYDYLNSVAMFCYDTVADLKSAENLIVGSYVKTLGFRSSTDGGGGIYKISNTGTANEMDVIACQNSLYAILIPDLNALYPEKFGAYGDNSHDDSTYFQYILDNYDVLKLYPKTYKVKNITVLGNKSVIGDGWNTILQGDNTGNCFSIYDGSNSEIRDAEIKNLLIKNYSVGIYAINAIHCLFERIRIRDCNLGARFAGVTYVNRFYACEFIYNTTDGFECGLEVTHPILNLTVTPIIGTFNFFDCGFANNGRHGLNGWLQMSNFFGGYSEGNAEAAIRLVNTDTRQVNDMLFSGFDIERAVIGYMFEGTGDYVKAHDINIVGGQINRNDIPATTVTKTILFKGTRVSREYVYNFTFTARKPSATSDNNTYDIYADCSNLAQSSISGNFNSSNHHNCEFITNLYMILPQPFYTYNQEIDLILCGNKYNYSTGKVNLDNNEILQLNLPNLIYINSIEVTTTSAASLSAYIYGQRSTSLINTKNINASSDENNKTTLGISNVGSVINIRNATGSAVTISKILIDGLIKK